MTISPTSWPQLSSLLDTALELPQAQRLSWLAQLDLDNQDLKMQLRELLTVDCGIGNPLHKPPDFSASLKEEAPRSQHMNVELQAGRLIGPYRLLRELGRGGMGAVWLAERVDGKFKREVALKFPYAGPHQRQLAERLIREREILAGLQHAHIARMYDADVTASGQPFLVLEYVDGIAIHQYCDRQRLNVRERLVLFQQVLNAVRYAHSRSVIHRDIKPSNILVTADGAAHLLDFGIATLITDGEVHETPLTLMSGHLLTPEYASPEQLSRAPLTTASDIYALGVVLYELLIGNSPYRQSREQRAQLEQAIVNADVVTPSRVTISRHAAENRNTQPSALRRILRGELDILLLKTLKRNVDDRYASVDMLLEDIRRYLDHQPILAQPDSRWYRFRKFVQRNRLAVASVATIMIALLVGTGLALWQAHIAKQQRDRAIVLASRGEAITEFMRLMVTETADADAPVTMQTLLARAQEVASKTFAGNTEQQVAVLGVLGGYYLTFDKSELAKDSFVKALELTANNSDLALKAQLNCRAGRAYDQLGNVNAATTYIEKGMSMSHGYPEVEALCLQERGRLLYEKGDYKGALKIQELAQSKLRGAINDPVMPAELLSDSADAALELGDVAAADRLYAMAIDHLNKMGRGEQSLAMQIYNNWSGVESYSGNPRGALEYLDKARAIALKRGLGATEGAGHSANRGAQLFKLARYEESLSEYQRGIDYAEKNRNVSDIAATKQGMARTLIMLDRLPEAERLMTEAESMINKYLRTDANAAEGATLLKGLLALKKKRCGDAVSELSRNIDVYTAHNENNGVLVYNLFLRGEAYKCKDNSADALHDATRAYELARKLQRNMQFSKSSGETALLLAKIESKLKQPDVARKWATIAAEQLQGSLGDEHPTTIEAKQLLAQVTTH